MSQQRALIIGDGPSYHQVASYNWSKFDGFIVSTHFYRHRAGAVVSIDPKGFQHKERHALGKTRLVIALSHWANANNLKRLVPTKFHSQIEWPWCSNPVLTSGVYAIEWAAKQGYKEIYTIGIDLPVGYHRKLDTQRPHLAKTLAGLRAKGCSIYKRSHMSTLPVPVADPALFLPEADRPPPVRAAVNLWTAALRTTASSTSASAPQRKPVVRATVPPREGHRRVLIHPKDGKGRPRVLIVKETPHRRVQ